MTNKLNAFYYIDDAVTSYSHTGSFSYMCHQIRRELAMILVIGPW